MKDRTLYLERPSFWTEDRDPECWRRGLKVLANLEKENGVIRGTPRVLWQKNLKQVMSRRSVPGLFGDRQRKLARWVIHEDFNDCLAEVRTELVTTEDTESTESTEKNE